MAVQSVVDSIRTFGDRYLERVFTEAERGYCAAVAAQGGDSAPHLAARFAAKEAVIKVLRPAAGEPLAHRSVEVVRGVDGACSVRLEGNAEALARRAGLSEFAISFSHEEGYATAIAVAQSASAALRRRPRAKGAKGPNARKATRSRSR